MGILDKFTNIDDLLVSLIERIGGVTEEDTHFFSYPADGTRATVQAGKTTLDFMGGTVMDTDGAVTSLGNSLRARGREYCRSLTLQGDQDIVVQIGTKSKIPIYAGLRFKVSHLRFTEVKIITTVPTELTLIACTNADAVSIDGEIITRTGLGINNLPSDYFKADEGAVIKGADGAAKREVLVDGSGIMLSRMKGADGAVLKDIAVDSDGVMMSRMKGTYAGGLRDIAVDNNGYMKALLKGLYNGYPKDIATDGGGTLLARMCGVHAGLTTNVAVDADGYMISVMKGDYAGAMKTWKVDAEGRGEMFIADTTDVWGQVRQMGLAELAVRTHAPPLVFDRRGDVIRWCDFETPARQYDTFTFNATAARTNVHSNTGDFCYKCQHTGHPGIVTFAMSTQDFHVGNIGLQMQFSVAYMRGYFVLKIVQYTGTEMLQYYIEFDFDNKTIHYNATAGQVFIGTFDFYPKGENFSTCKLVVDLAAERALRLVVFGKEYDLSALVCDAVPFPDATAPHLLTGFEMGSTGTGNNVIYVDNIVLTENEPI